MSFQDQENARLNQSAYDGCRYEFETIAVEDRAATLANANGHIAHRNQDICHVFKVGGNGEKVVWIIEELPPEKRARIEKAYAAWKSGQEEPLNGTDLRNWPAISKAEVANCRQYHIRTVEDLANIPDSLLPNLGMGARATREKAKAWCSSDVKLAQQVADLSTKVERLLEMNSEKDETIKELQAQLPRKPGRPRREDAEAA